MKSQNRNNLRDQMVIRKARNKNRVITTKSLIMFICTWILWLAAVYFLLDDHQALFFEPIIGTWTLIDMVKAVAVVTLTQLNILFCWSILATSRVHTMRSRRRNAAKAQNESDAGHHSNDIGKE